jgi:hypothetical protein
MALDDWASNRVMFSNCAQAGLRKTSKSGESR